MVILAVLIASISIGSCVKTVDKTLKGSLLTESPKILSSSSIQGISKVNYAASNNSWNLSDKDSLQYAGMDWVRTGAERSQTIGDMGGEEMVERPTFGDMGGEEMVERRTFEGWRIFFRFDGKLIFNHKVQVDHKAIKSFYTFI